MSFWGASATRATMLKCAADNLRCRLISSRGLSHHAAISAPLGKMMDCTTGLQFVLPESNNESQEDPKIELPNPYFSGSMELMAVPKRKVGFGTLFWLFFFFSFYFLMGIVRFSVSIVGWFKHLGLSDFNH